MEDDSSSADDADGNAFEILSAEDGRLEYIWKIKVMAGLMGELQSEVNLENPKQQKR